MDAEGHWRRGVLAHAMPPSEAERCARAVQAIWRSLDDQVLESAELRAKLALSSSRWAYSLWTGVPSA